MDQPLSCQPIQQFQGGSTQRLLSRSKLFLCPQGQDRLLAMYGEEHSKTVRGKIRLKLKLKVSFSSSIPASIFQPQIVVGINMSEQFLYLCLVSCNNSKDEVCDMVSHFCLANVQTYKQDYYTLLFEI